MKIVEFLICKVIMRSSVPGIPAELDILSAHRSIDSAIENFNYMKDQYSSCHVILIQAIADSSLDD